MVRTKSLHHIGFNNFEIFYIFAELTMLEQRKQGMECKIVAIILQLAK